VYEYNLIYVSPCCNFVVSFARFVMLIYLYSVAVFRIGKIAGLLTKDALVRSTSKSCSETQNAKNKLKRFGIPRTTQTMGTKGRETVCTLAGESDSLFLGTY
jgi:hypothetical protein